MLTGTYKPLDTSDATATAEDIVKDKTAYVNGEKVVGELEVNNDYDIKIKFENNATRYLLGSANYKELDYSNMDTSYLTDFSNGFKEYTKLTKVIGLDLSNNTNFSNVFYMCSALTEAPELNTSNGTIFTGMFHSCVFLVDMPEYDLSKATTLTNFLAGCSRLKNVGGFKNLGKGFTAQTADNSACKLYINKSNVITYESLVNVLSKLYDLNLTYDVANGGTLYRQSVIMGETNLAKLQATEEGQQLLAEVDAKGWNVS